MIAEAFSVRTIRFQTHSTIVDMLYGANFVMAVVLYDAVLVVLCNICVCILGSFNAIYLLPLSFPAPAARLQSVPGWSRALHVSPIPICMS